ncbi:tetratricopeptide repeat protein [Shouchella clausii]|uniref:response regulator aspartate phosphatase n=1 Tax=Shouchella clausii TaxID=79880 RepID=UPI001C73747C|nr:tetratricopeptide repeat protein [Shouchella clausii]MBX0320098.1 tetratricopeptide repeat protein [Shouchella clausii]MEB5480893.1 tetratricopeptide repeat protein [Shouchella clausii]
MSLVTTEKAGAKIVEWYSCIISRSVDQAILLREKTKQLIETTDCDDKIVAFFQLVDFRHQMMMKQNSKNEITDLSIEKSFEPSIDDMLKYLYYFISGQNEYINERYKSAIKLFRKAERLLEYIQDDAEEAEFYQYTGLVYYRLNQYLVASSYMEQAETIFNRLGYVERAINTRLILGLIYSELGDYEKGDQIIREALITSRPFPVTNALALRSLGLSKQRQRDFNEAEDYFKQALEITEHKDSQAGTKTRYNLANVLFRQEKHESAMKNLKMAEVGAKYYQNFEYTNRCLFSRGLYCHEDFLIVDKAINNLQENAMFFETFELAEEAANFAEKAGNTEMALKYMKCASQACLKFNYLGDDQK